MTLPPANTSHSQIAPDFSIIIPAWNESAHIVKTVEKALEAMAQQRFTGNIIVVDNNSTDDTAIKAKQAGAEVVFEPINQIGRARNTGANASHSQWLVFLDADTTVSTPLLSSSLEAMVAGEALGGGSTLKFDRDVAGLAKLGLGLWNWWSVKSSTAAGCYIYCTREAFDTVGQFDEKQYVAEELFLSKKLRKLAKQHGQRFVIQTHTPIVSSARKMDWYSAKQKLWQILLLLIPGATRSKKMCGVWYDRSNIKEQ